MKTLIQIEFLKLWKLGTFRIMMLVYALAVPLIIIGLGNLPIPLPFMPDLKQVASFPNIWAYGAYGAGWMNLLVALVIVIITSNEIKYRTLKQNVIDGLSKQQVIFSKFYLVLILSSIITTYTFLTCLVFGFIYSDNYAIFDGIYPIGIYFLQTIGYFSFAFFLTILLRLPALSIILFICSFALESILGLIAIPQHIYAYFPLNTLSSLTPFPLFREMIEQTRKHSGEIIYVLEPNMRIVIGFIYISIFITASYFILKRRDL